VRNAISAVMLIALLAGLLIALGCGDDKSTGPERGPSSGTFLVQTGNALIAVRRDGTTFTVCRLNGSVDTYDGRIFITEPTNTLTESWSETA